MPGGVAEVWVPCCPVGFLLTLSSPCALLAANCHRSCYSLALSAAKPIKESLGATCGGGAEIFLAEQANV